MELIRTILPGCYQVRPFLAKDERGTFIKTFNAVSFSELGLPTDWREEYYSNSRIRVIRGMHFQKPPHDHDKMVFCLQGRALDVVLDLRIDLPTYGRHFAIELNAECGHGLIVPKGVAHGFQALCENVLMAYKVTSAYAPEHDAGIRWDSFGFDWGLDNPIVSVRDRAHPAFSDFKSPFRS